MPCSVCGNCNSVRELRLVGYKDDALCNCRKKPAVSRTLPNLSVVKNKFALYNLGVEIEASDWRGLGRPDGNRGAFGGIGGTWFHDGSVTSGVEWASDPLTVKPSNVGRTNEQPGLVNSLLAIADAFEANNLRTDSTCGLHVHIDQRDLSYWEVSKLWANYIAIQDHVYRFCHPSREAVNVLRNRSYCHRYTPQLGRNLRWMARHPQHGEFKPWVTQQLFETSTEAIRDASKRANRRRAERRFNGTPPNTPIGFLPQDLTTLKKYKYHNNRYYGLNVMPWFKQGTIEWRMQGHPYNSEDIVMWSLACCNMTHKLVTGPLLSKPLQPELDVFLDWLQPPVEIGNYLTTKHKQFARAWETSTIEILYKELV